MPATMTMYADLMPRLRSEVPTFDAACIAAADALGNLESARAAKDAIAVPPVTMPERIRPETAGEIAAAFREANDRTARQLIDAKSKRQSEYRKAREVAVSALCTWLERAAEAKTAYSGLSDRLHAQFLASGRAARQAVADAMHAPNEALPPVIDQIIAMYVPGVRQAQAEIGALREELLNLNRAVELATHELGRLTAEARGDVAG